MDGHTPTRTANPDGYDFDYLIQEDRVHRHLYTEEPIFKAEMNRVFGAVWVYLGHESQIPNNDDFVQTKLGLRPIVLVRDSAGKIRALYNRCTHRGSTVCRQDSGSAKAFQCPYHGWTFLNSGEIKGVPWPEGYADDFSDAKFNLAQVPRVDSYKGFIFGTLNMDAPSLLDYLGPVATPLAEWVDRHPGGRVELCNANRLKLHGNWKLVYDNSADGYHVVFSHRSLLAMENRLSDVEDKGMAFYKESPDTAPMYVYYFGNGHHFKDKRGNVERGRPGALWEIEGLAPGLEYFEEKLRREHPDRANEFLDLAASEPMNINVFPNLHILGNHIQVVQPLSVTETDTTWWGTAVVDDDNVLDGAVGDINAIRMRTQEGFPNFGEVDDLMNFEQIQVGLQAEEDEWAYTHRGLGLPDRFSVDAAGTIKGPATDEVFLREYFKEYRRLMTTEPDIQIAREV